MLWMRDHGRRFTTATAMLVAALGCAVGAAYAQAGEYHVYSCRMPDGSVAPTDGWSGNASGGFVYAENKCAKGGALVAALGDGTEHEGTDIATWTFTTPSEESLIGATIWRAGDADGGAAADATYEYWLAAPTETNSFDDCVYLSCTAGEGEPEEPLAAVNRFVLSPDYLGSDLYLNAACYDTFGRLCKKGEHDPNGYAAVIYVYAADLTLEQSSQPTVTDVEGELAFAATLSGISDLSFHADDAGSGVYQAVFTVDGVEVGRTVLNENGGRCHDVGQTSDGLPAFLYLQPCPASLEADVPFDTTTLTDGTHHLVVAITDAAGNSTVALDRKVTVSNHPAAPNPPHESSEESTLPTEPTKPTSPAEPTSPPPSGSPPQSSGSPQSPSANQAPTVTAANLPSPSANLVAQLPATLTPILKVRWSATAKTAFTASYGHAQTVAGRLTDPSGAPISGAVVQVLSTPSFQGAKTEVLANLRTSANGDFQIRLAPNLPSTRLTFAYGSRLGQPVPEVTASLTLTVPAHLSLAVEPHTSHIGGTIVFMGTLSGSSLPPGGKQLVLEARSEGAAWRQFRVLATGPHGHYRATYRFRLAGPVTYQFRVTCAREADFPYGAGASNIVRVLEQ